MNRRKTKLRLRKQVLISFPLALIVSVFAVIYIFSQNTALAQEVEKDNALMANTEVVIEKENYEPSILSTNKFMVELNRRMKLQEKDNLIEEYSKLYKIDSKKAISIAHELTNDYQSDVYKNTFVIAPANYSPYNGEVKNEEMGIIIFVKDLCTYPERYGSSIPEMRLDETPTTIRRYNASGELVMYNGMTFEQYVGKMADLFGVDKSITLAISYHEAGIKTSNLFTLKNNIGGHKGLEGWKAFTTLEAGVIGHVFAVRNISMKHDVDITTPEGLSAFSSVYVNGYLGNPSAHWTEKVTYFKNDINSKDLFTIE